MERSCAVARGGRHKHVGDIWGLQWSDYTARAAFSSSGR
jgi:hypothetical protein